MRLRTVLLGCGAAAVSSALAAGFAGHVGASHNTLVSQGSALDLAGLPAQPSSLGEASPSPLPMLTAAQVTVVKQLIGADRLMARLLAGVQPSAYPVEAWTRLKDNGLIGAEARLRLTRPISFTEAIPTIAYDATETSLPYYASQLHRFRVADAHELVVSVDLTTNQIVGLHWDADATATAIDPLPAVSAPPGRPARHSVGDKGQRRHTP